MAARTAALLALGAVALAGCGPGAARPDIVLIVVDTLRADHLEVYGYPRPTSPRLRELARASAVFESSYAAAPWTKPSVASLLTSLAPGDHGVVDWQYALDDELLTLAEVLRDAGYATEAYVSHHALEPGANRFEQGFSVYDASAFRLLGEPGDITSSAAVSDRGIAALAEARDRPLFLWLHYFDPHAKYLGHAGFERGDRPVDRYDSEIAFTDHQIGRLLDALDARGRDAIVAVTADHGEEFGDHGGALHTTKLYQELIRVPLLLRGPGIAPQTVDAPVSGIDVAPTLLALAGVPVPDAFRGRAIPRVDGRFRAGDAAPVFAETRRGADRRAVVHEGWKLIEDLRGGTLELYDLAHDPGERADRSRAEPARTARLLALLRDHFARPPREAPVLEPDPDRDALLELLGYAERGTGKGE